MSSSLQHQKPRTAAMPPQATAGSTASCLSNNNLDDFDLQVQHLPSVANCTVPCECCSLCCLPEVSEVGDSSAAEISSGNGTVGTTATTSDTSLMLSDHLPSSPRQEATGQLQKLSNHQGNPSDRLSSIDWLPLNDPLVPLSITIPRTRIRLGSKGKALIRRGAEASALLSTSIDNTDYFNTFLPDDTVCSILRFLDVKSLLRMRECSTKLRSAASSNNAGWSDHCSSLWSRKANVCSRARSLIAQSIHPSSIPYLTNNIAMEAFKTSVVDAATRQEVSLEELCYDELPFKGGPVWSFRFKESAGVDWTSWDPWYNGQEARKLVFLRDGIVLQLQPKGKTAPRRIHNGVPLYDVFAERTVHRDGVDVIPPRIELKWRFVQRPLDLPARPDGAYVRITVGGRDVPTYVCRRSPNGNWGFLLESCWGVYASFDLAPRGTASPSTSRRLRRTRNGTQWVNVDDSDSEAEPGDHTRNVRRRTNLVVEESAMVVTGHSQWREALLYNIGAVALPEGNANSEQEVRERFNLAWRNSRN